MSVENLIADFKHSFYADDLKSMQNLYRLLSELSESDPQVSILLSSAVEFQKFKEDCVYFEQCILHLESSEWDLISNNDGIKVESHCSGADFYTRASVVMNSNILETISVVCEVDLLPSWYIVSRIHALSEISVISSPSHLRKLMKYHFWFPWPLINRECVLEFSTYPIMQDQALLLMMRTPKETYLDQEIPREEGENIRMNVTLGAVYIQFISNNLTKVTILVQANASIIPSSLLPDWLINFGKKQIMYFLMHSLRNNATNFQGSEYQTRVNSKTEFYSFLKRYLCENVEIF